MSVRSSASNLAQAVKDLSLHWQQARSSWRDAKSIEFEETYLQDLTPHVSKTATAIEELDNILRKIKSDCE